MITFVNKKKGFTILELLVVIAIIGILTTIVMVSLTDARKKGKNASAIQTMQSTLPSLISCEDDGLAIGDPTGESDTNDPQISICAGAPDYAKLEAGWNYSTYTNTAIGDGLFSLQASDGDFTIECTQTGCQQL